MVFAEVDFLRRIGSFLLFCGLCCGHPVAVGEHTIAIDSETGRHKYVINAAFGLQFRVIAVEGAVLGKSHVSVVVAVVE